MEAEIKKFSANNNKVALDPNCFLKKKTSTLIYFGGRWRHYHGLSKVVRRIYGGVKPILAWSSSSTPGLECLWFLKKYSRIGILTA